MLLCIDRVLAFSTRALWQLFRTLTSLTSMEGPSSLARTKSSGASPHCRQGREASMRLLGFHDTH